ncbi:sporulation histidine kinase inhibitor Sda [Halalkalibacter sp. APA_J-10(15)]|nr:sporulation histidine kinase inhibitor Sda [Halalkalibacter sp. APA_J-10(15)]MCK0472508.1 sporulation histidine kinase inhibitor Sda [Halalkalibacter sp. APA_J-10(15)]
MQQLTDEQLLEAYAQARKAQLNESFLTLLLEEIKRRDLQDEI